MSIIVKVEDLKNVLDEAEKIGCKIIEVDVIEAEEDEDEPSFISISGCRPEKTDCWYDFDEIEAVQDEEELQMTGLTAMHMSSNLA